MNESFQLNQISRQSVVSSRIIYHRLRPGEQLTRVITNKTISHNRMFKRSKR